MRKPRWFQLGIVGVGTPVRFVNWRRGQVKRVRTSAGLDRGDAQIVTHEADRVAFVLFETEGYFPNLDDGAGRGCKQLKFGQTHRFRIQEFNSAAGFDLELACEYVDRTLKLKDFRSVGADAGEIEIAEQGKVDERVDRVNFAGGFQEADVSNAVIDRVVPDRQAITQNTVNGGHELKAVAVTRERWIITRRHLYRIAPVLAVRTGRQHKHAGAGWIVERSGQAATRRVQIMLRQYHDEMFVIAAQIDEAVRPGSDSLERRRIRI